MLHFLQNFVYYLTLEVIGPNAHEMETGLQEALDMDQVRRCAVCGVVWSGVV
jgi:Gamma tubulin complex component C-terminal